MGSAAQTSRGCLAAKAQGAALPPKSPCRCVDLGHTTPTRVFVEPRESRFSALTTWKANGPAPWTSRTNHLFSIY